MKCTAFIADLHLNAQQPEVFAVWQRFLREQLLPLKPDALYILGDFFTLWIGDDDLSSFNAQVIATIKSLAASGMKVYLLPGNRDFMLGEKFAAMSGCVLLSDPIKIDLYGVPTVLTHGDILCTKDKAMNIFRFLTRGKWCKRIFLFLPLTWRRKIAGVVHNISQKARRGPGKPKEILAVDDQAVKRMLLQHQAQQIIHGHIHETNIVPIATSLAADKVSQRFVLGEWTINGGNVLLCYDNGQCELKFVQNL